MKAVATLFCIICTVFLSVPLIAQSCDQGGCSNSTNQFPNGTFSTTSSSWSTVSTGMNAGNWTLFSVTAGNTYEWTYCSDFGGSQAWNAELTLFNYSTGVTLCYQNNSNRSNCPNSPYLGWTATFTGTVKLLTSAVSGSNCQSNSGSPYSKLVWRQSASGCSGWSVNPTSNQFGPSGGSGSFTVSASGSCSYNSTSNNSWINNISYPGGGATSFNVDANSGGARSGTISVKDAATQQTVGTYTVNQSGCTAPSAPGSFTVQNITSNSADVSWSTVSGSGITYEVMKNNTSCSFAFGSSGFTSSGSSGTVYNLTPNTQYYFVVVAGNSCGSSTNSNCVSFTTTGGGTPPPTPTGFSATATSSSTINLSWNASSGATNYMVEWCSGSFTDYTSNTSYTITGLNGNTYYDYHVRAINSSGVSSFTACQGATTLTGGSAPPTPNGLTANPGSTTTIDLSWNASSGATSYEIRTCSGALITSNVTTTSYTVLGLSPSTFYEYKVSAVNSTGYSSYSSCAGATTLGSGGNPPATPTGLSATAISPYAIKLIWDVSSDATNYEIYSCGGTLIASSAGTTYTVSGLTTNTYYEYKIRATNTWGNSAYTVCSGVTTQGASSTPSYLVVKNVIPNNSSFPDKVLFQGITAQSILPIKICADGSTATKIVFTNKTSVDSKNIRFWIVSDTFGVESDKSGYFIQYGVSGNVVTASFAHPKFLDSQYRPYRADKIIIVDYTNPTEVIFTIPIQIFRAPVLMVHGLWGDPDVFKKMDKDWFVNLGYYPASLTFRADYKDSASYSFNLNSSVVPKGINILLTDARNNSFSAGKVDILSHSMGGMLSRQYIQGDPFQKRENVHRLITINTPHSGSQAGNLMMNKITCESITARILITLKLLTTSSPFDPDKNRQKIDDGAVEDLKINSHAIYMMNTIRLNNGIVPSHSIVTLDELNILKPNALYLVYEPTGECIFKDADDFVYYLFDKEENDLIVSRKSQTGGLTGTNTSVIYNQQHLGSPSNKNVIQTVLNVLSTSSSNPHYFSQSGFSPSTNLNTYYKNELKTGDEIMVTGDVEINYPVTGLNYNPGQEVTVAYSTSSNIVKVSVIVFFGGSDSVVNIDTTQTNGTLRFNVPLDAYEAAAIIVMGYDGVGELISYDTCVIKVNLTATLDSLSFDNENLLIQHHQFASLRVTGHFSDGYSHDISSYVSFKASDTTIIYNTTGNLFQGKNEGATLVRVTYMGVSEVIPAIVFPSDSLFELPTGFNHTIASEGYQPSFLKIYPNPAKEEFTLEIHSVDNEVYESIGRIEVYDQLGKRVFYAIENPDTDVITKKISVNNLAPGVYFIKVVTQSSILSEKIVVE